ncbi:MAG: T9SS type A sorting domain-containing protein [Bacteroidetes bacterium]|nr:T9SS type A sorting domain-containing protein [Bacteroidota bacterium]
MKIKFLLVIIIAFAAVSSIFAEGWESRSSGLGNVFFKCVAFSSATNVFVGGNLNSIKSTNAGDNWSVLPAPVAGTVCNSIFFTNALTGYFGCTLSGTTAIYKTTDGGLTFTTSLISSDVNINSINFPSLNTGYAACGSGNILKTTNAGVNWIYTPTPSINKFAVFSVSFANDSVGFVAGSDGIFIKTTNGGNNWETHSVGVSYAFYSISTTDILNAYGVGEGAIMAKTTDGGITWIGTSSPSIKAELRSVDFKNTLTGYACGNTGFIMRTTNGGINWTQQTSQTTHFLSGIKFWGYNLGIAVGYNSTILKTTDGGGSPIGIHNINNEKLSFFKLNQNYPNPFNPSTHINFSIPENGDVMLKILDISGKEIFNLIGSYLSKGEYERTFDGTNLASGIYFYKLEFKGISGKVYSDEKKLVLIK